MTFSIFNQIATKIIKEQELIIGPLAWLQAQKVKDLKVINQNTGEVSIENSNNQSVIDTLVGQYERIFGRASREVCKDAAASLLADLPPQEIPSSLK
jgi:hypothetical protein